MNESKTPRTDALIMKGPLAGPRDWIAFWDMAVDAHREIESDLAAALSERDALAARVEKAEADAERYRFIRDADRSDCITREIGLYAMETLDEYVDAAMEDEAALARGVKS